ASKLLPEINEQAPSEEAFNVKITQMRLERRLGEAIRLMQARLVQLHFFSEVEKADLESMLAFLQRLAGDSAGAGVTAKQARDEVEEACKTQNSVGLLDDLALANAVLGEKDSALKAVERSVILQPTAKDRVNGPNHEEMLALIHTTIGEHGRAISVLTQLVKAPYFSYFYGVPITPALLRLDPIWDPLRSDPAFEKLCEEKR